MDKHEMMNLLHHIITVSRHWHLEYARLFVSDSAYQQIVEDRNTFDESLLKKGENIINGIERESDIEKIIVYFNGHEVVFSKAENTHGQLRQMADKLESDSSIYTQNATKKLYIDNDAVVGYEIIYKTEYSELYKKD